MSKEIIMLYDWLTSFVDAHPYNVVFMPAVNYELVYNEYYGDQYSAKVMKPLHDLIFPFFSVERELDESIHYLNCLHRQFALDELIETL